MTDVLTVNDLFCGAGGFGLGFKQAGFEILGAWDFDKFSVESYKSNVDENVVLKDVRDMTGDELPDADVWTFGFPCTDISIAGKKKGITGENSGVFFEVMRLLSEVDQKPKILLAENVKRVVHDIDVVCKEFDKAGYTTYWQLYDSSHWGVAQKRERYFIVGVRHDIGLPFDFPMQEPQSVPLSSALEENVGSEYFVNEETTDAIIFQALERIGRLYEVHACLTPKRVNRRQMGRRARPNEEPMYTLTAQDRHGVIDLRGRKPSVRILTPRECANMQGFPSDYKQVVSDNEFFKQMGNAVTVPISRAIAEQIKYFLKDVSDANH